MTGTRLPAHPRTASWGDARAAVHGLVGPIRPRMVALPDAIGAVTVTAVRAPGPMPHYDSSAMDGWAVRGAGPWTAAAGALHEGGFQAVVTGGLLPTGTEAVLRSEAGERDGDRLTGRRPAAGLHVRRAGEEAGPGDELVPAGLRLDAATVAVLQLAGLDDVLAVPRPRVAAVLTGEEVVATGRPAPGRVRDAFVPLLPEAVRGLGALPASVRRVGDDAAAIAAAVLAADADLVVTTGGTGRSEADRLRDALELLGAAVLLDGIAMRPGHPALVARLPDGRLVLALPGNPLAAVVALLTLLPPAVAGAVGRPLPEPAVSRAARAFDGRAGTTLVLPARRVAGGHEAADAVRPNMLRGLAASDALAVVPESGVPAGADLQVLPLPWRR